MSCCLVCFSEIHYNGILSFILKPKICHKCFLKLNRKPKVKHIDDFKVYSLFPYEKDVVSLIYQLKGCYDYALAPVFLSYDWFILKIIFHNYIIVPVPSYLEKDKERRFNHVEAIFSLLGLPIEKILYKEKDYKQSSLNKENRKKAVMNIKLKCKKDLSSKRFLLVDDIVTTGYTLKRCMSLLETLNPKNIKVVTIAYSMSKNVEI